MWLRVASLGWQDGEWSLGDTERSVLNLHCRELQSLDTNEVQAKRHLQQAVTCRCIICGNW
jgi:hypothetical protein